MAALEQASAYGDIEPLAKVFADQVREQSAQPLPTPHGASCGGCPRKKRGLSDLRRGPMSWMKPLAWLFLLPRYLRRDRRRLRNLRRLEGDDEQRAGGLAFA